MMQRIPKAVRVLAIVPTSRGFGFAVSEFGDCLVDWGVKSIEGDKNSQCLDKIKQIISFYKPGAIILQDVTAKHSRRCHRVQTLTKSIAELANSFKMKTILIKPNQVKLKLLENGTGTKHSVAKVLANRFPDELGMRLPPQRRPWMSEDYRMGMFEAVALVVVSQGGYEHLKQR